MSWVQVPVKVACVAGRLSTIEKRSKGHFFSVRRSEELRPNTRKFPEFGSCKDVRFRDNNNHLHDIQRNVSCDQVYGKFQPIVFGKYKHLSNFPQQHWRHSASLFIMMNTVFCIHIS
jgi:hypothetical protein